MDLTPTPELLGKVKALKKDDFKNLEKNNELAFDMRKMLGSTKLASGSTFKDFFKSTGIMDSIRNAFGTQTNSSLSETKAKQEQNQVELSQKLEEEEVEEQIETAQRTKEDNSSIAQNIAVDETEVRNLKDAYKEKSVVRRPKTNIFQIISERYLKRFSTP